MSQVRRLVYLFDPLCGWCYGASAALHRLAVHPDFAVELAPTGLFSGGGARPMDDNFAAYAWANDQRIAQLTGQLFSESYRHNILGDRTRLFDSGPATLALTAVAHTAPVSEPDALFAIQKARYIDGRDITDPSVLIEILRAIGLNAAADALAAMDAHLVTATRRRTEAARADMRQLGVQGVPTLIADDGAGRNLVKTSMLVGNVDDLIAKLQAA